MAGPKSSHVYTQSESKADWFKCCPLAVLTQEFQRPLGCLWWLQGDMAEAGMKEYPMYPPTIVEADRRGLEDIFPLP